MIYQINVFGLDLFVIYLNKNVPGNVHYAVNTLVLVSCLINNYASWLSLLSITETENS